MRASASGAFSATVPAPFGTSVITVAATKGNATGYARRTVISEFITGTTVLDVTDPDGDDNGPGTYAYPTSSNFQPGAFDLQRFQVIVDGDNVLLRAKVRNLSPTFGSPIGAQLLDLYVHDADGSHVDGAAFPSRNYAIAADSAWTRRIEVQGFADPVFVDASGTSLGTVSVLASQASGFITMIVPVAALGTPGPGWKFTVVLHGQDGFSRRPGPRLRADAAAVPVRRLRAAAAPARSARRTRLRCRRRRTCSPRPACPRPTSWTRPRPRSRSPECRSPSPASPF